MEQQSEIKYMIMTLGGSTEPLAKSIELNRPDSLVFFASHDSVTLSGQIFNSINFKPKVEYEITENPNLLFECFQTAQRCVERVKKVDVSPEEVMVDYTGGTKVMTAGLILAAAGQKFRYNYVGGDRRNKNGLGTVEDGHEKMFAEMSPWAVFAEEERRQVITLFNSRRYAAVKEIIDLAREKELPVQIKKYFKFIDSLAMGFLKWDQFEHKDAKRFFDEGLISLADYLQVYSESDLQRFSKQVVKCRTFLDLVLSETAGIKKFHRILIDDLLNNARRKIEDKRYDDAAARIYRALELYGQIRFQKAAGCHNDKVKPEVIPLEIRDKFVKKYQGVQSPYLKLPLYATFEYLKKVGDEAGKKYFNRIKEIKNIQSNRNESILAHGIKPVSEKAINSILETVTNFIGAIELIEFPKLP